MIIPGLRSPHAKIGGLVYFGRMLDKIRLHAVGQLPKDYIPNLGAGFDAACLRFLWIEYPDLVARVKEGGTDDEILAWAFSRGRKPSDDESFVWNEFMRKRGWRDDLSDRLAMRKAESGFENRPEIQTFFDYIDADEGRPVSA